MPDPNLAPDSISNLFDRMFSLIPGTLRRNATLGIIAALPGTLLMVMGFYMLVNSGAVWEMSDGYLTEKGLSMFWGVLIFIGGFIVLMIADVWCSLAAIRVVHREMNGEFISASDAISSTWKQFWSALGFSVIEVLIFIGIILAALLVGALVGAPWGETAGPLVIIVLVGLAAIPIIYLSIAWIFGLNAIVIDGAGPVAAFSKSAELVKGVWWKVLLFVLIAALFQFISNGVTGLISMFGVFEIHGFESMNVTDTDRLFEIAERMGDILEWIIGTGISVVIAMVVSPIYSTVLYVVRKDITTKEDNAAESDETIDITDNLDVLPE